MDKHLHIITHDVPWPVAHGGLFDLYNKLVALHRQGIQIHLHCFKATERKVEAKAEVELARYCVSVNYYERKTGMKGVSFNRPYIVYSRDNNELVNALLKDNYPVLVEGIHCTAFLKDKRFKERKIFIRLHNVEYKYYCQLAKNETNIFKKIYYNIESRLLKKYERSIAGKAIFLAVSDEDAKLYRNEFHARVHFLPAFLPFKKISTERGKGSFCLYHGNLSVNENEKAAIWLLKEVFNSLEIPFVIAGKNPSSFLRTLGQSKISTCIVINPSDEEMQDLIQKAQINVIPSFNTTGVKLKLLNVLFNGRYCLANDPAVLGSGVAALCLIANNTTEFREKIKKSFTIPFSEDQIKMRAEFLQKIYDNEKNAKQLMTWIW